MNGRYWVDLDPAGYFYAKEPGLDFLINGDDLMGKLDPDHAGIGSKAHRFWTPPGSTWMRGAPRQFDPEWFRNDNLGDYVLRANRWTWASGITPTEWEMTRIPGTSYPANQWISIHVPETGDSLDSRDYGAMAAVAGMNLPTGLKTVAFCGHTPAGTQFSLTSTGLTPYVQWINYPAPHNACVYGFGQVAVICYQDNYAALHTPDGGSGWLLLEKGKLSSVPPAKASPAGRQGSASLLQAQAARAEIRSMLAHTAGRTDLYLIPGAGETKGMPLRRKPADDVFDTQIKAGPFWIAGMPGQMLGFQAQVVGFESASTEELNIPDPAVWFDLSAFYKPSVAPKFSQDALITELRGGAATTSIIDDNGSVYIHNTDSGQSIRYGLLNEAGEAWDFEAGETHKGSLLLELTPGWTGGPEPFLSPEIAHIELRFPVVLEPRVNSLKRLNDTQFDALEAETALRDPLAKRVRIELTDLGLETISASGHDARANYPVHILQDTNNDGVPDVIRVAGWVQQFRVEEIAAEHSQTGKPIQSYSIEGGGLLSRGNQKWLYLPQMVNPESSPPGTVEHTFAVEQTIRSTGIDTEDAAFYLAQTDPHAGTDLARLPGTWGIKSGEIGKVETNAWGPTWKQTKTGYAAETGRKCRGWVLYETLGRLIRYHDDLLRETERGAQYVVSATLYRTPAEAIAAGVPKQIYLTLARGENIEPEGNVIRVSGEDAALTITPQVIERDGLSITDITYPHFIGEPKTHAVEPRQAVDLGAMQVQCRLLMERKGRRRGMWTAAAELAPWEMQPQSVDAGYVLKFGNRGDYQIEHLQWRLLKSDAADSLSVTAFTLTSSPYGAQLGPGGGPYPGRAGDPEE